MVATTLACEEDAKESLTPRTRGYIEQNGEIYLSYERLVGVLNCEKKKTTTFRGALIRLKGPSRL